MRLIVRPNVVEVEGTREEQKILRSILRFRDPSPYRYFDFREGSWSGWHNFLVNAGRGKLRFLTGFCEVVHRGLAARHAGHVEWLWSGDEIEVARPTAVDPEVLSGVTLRPYQVECANTCLRSRRGVVHAPPRSGKTEIQAALAATLDCASLLLVDKGDLLKQHYARFQERGLRDVGKLGGGTKKWHAQHVIATVQTLYRALKNKDLQARQLLDRVELLQADECHRLGSSEGFMRVFEICAAPYRFAYSGTPLKDTLDRHFEADDFRLLGAVGKVIYRISSAELQEAGFLTQPRLLIIPVHKPKVTTSRDWHAIYHEGIVGNAYRNRLIVRLAKYLYESGERTLILVRLLEHGDRLLKMLDAAGVPAVFSSGAANLATVVRGEISRDFGDVEQVKEQLAMGEIPCIVGSSIWDEGVDAPDLTSVVIAAGGKASTRTLQRAYRGMTATPDKDYSLIFDFRDTLSTVLARHSRHRIRDYRNEGIPVLTNLPEDLKKALVLG